MAKLQLALIVSFQVMMLCRLNLWFNQSPRPLDPPQGVGCDGANTFGILFCGHHQWSLATRGPRSRHFNNECFKVFLWSVDYWLIWQLFRWFIPWSLRFNSTRKSLGDQFADFLTLQRHERFISIIFVKLRTKIYDVNSWIISLHIEEIPRSKHVIFFYNFLLKRRSGYPQFVGGRTNDRAGF